MDIIVSEKNIIIHALISVNICLKKIGHWTLDDAEKNNERHKHNTQTTLAYLLRIGWLPAYSSSFLTLTF